jgi:hypothetical protein
MSQSLTRHPLRLALALAFCVSACGWSASGRWRQTFPPDYAVLSSSPALTIAVGGTTPYQIDFTREPVPVSTTLRALIATTDLAVAVGDGGVVLRRRLRQSWAREAAPTQDNLNAIAWEDERDSFLVVGDHGAIFLERDGKWIREAADSSNDLHAVLRGPYASYAVGKHGLLLYRTVRGWFSIPTGVTANLNVLWDCSSRYRYGTICAAGDHGTLIRCDPKRGCEQDTAPTTENLLGAGSQSFVVGTNGLILEQPSNDPHDWRVVAPVTQANLTWIASAGFGTWYMRDDGRLVNAESLLLDQAGTGWWITPQGTPAGSIAFGAAPLYGATFYYLDAFIVGASGTLWHGKVRGVGASITVQVSGK